MGENGHKTYISDNWLVSRIFKTFLQLNKWKKNSPIKCTKALSRHFHREDIQMANMLLKGCLKWLVIREIELKVQWDTTVHALEFLHIFGYNEK